MSLVADVRNFLGACFVWWPNFVEDPHEYEGVDEEEHQDAGLEEEGFKEGDLKDPGDNGDEKEHQAAFKADGVNNTALDGTGLGFLAALPCFKHGSPDEVPDNGHRGRGNGNGARLAATEAEDGQAKGDRHNGHQLIDDDVDNAAGSR